MNDVGAMSPDAIRSRIEKKRKEAYERADREAQRALEALGILEGILTETEQTGPARSTVEPHQGLDEGEGAQDSQTTFPMKLRIRHFIDSLPEDRLISQRTVYAELLKSVPEIRGRTEKSVRSQISAILKAFVKEDLLHLVRKSWAGNPAEYSKTKPDAGALLGGMEE